MSVDLKELMRLHAATATPELEQLCWYDVKPEQASFFETCLEDVPRLVAQLTELRADNERLRAEVEGMRIRFANLDAGHKMDVLRQSGDARKLTELREAAEAVRDRHELETLVTPEATRFCAVLAKVTP